MRHVITLSTIPPRFAGIGPALRSLVAQRSRPEAVELTIGIFMGGGDGVREQRLRLGDDLVDERVVVVGIVVEPSDSGPTPNADEENAQ